MIRPSNDWLLPLARRRIDLWDPPEREPLRRKPLIVEADSSSRCSETRKRNSAHRVIHAGERSEMRTDLWTCFPRN